MVMMIQGLPRKFGQEKRFKCLVTLESGKELRQPQTDPNVKILPNHFCSQIRFYPEQLCNSVNTSDFIIAGKQPGKQTAVPFFFAFSQKITQ